MDLDSEGKLVSVSALASSATDTEPPGAASEGAAESPGHAGTAQEEPTGMPQEEPASLGGSGAGPESVGRGAQTRGLVQSVAEVSTSSNEWDYTSQDLLSSLQRENSELRSLQMELSREKTNLSRAKQLMERQLQSTSAENVRLKQQLDALQKGRAQPGTERGASDVSMTDRALTAEQEARCAKAQLALLMEKYDRIERDNQAMADEIHRFREQIGRLQQCPSQGSSSRTRYITLGLSFLLGLAYFWFYLDELL